MSQYFGEYIFLQTGTWASTTIVKHFQIREALGIYIAFTVHISYYLLLLLWQ